jgi:hypothetical protein
LKKAVTLDRVNYLNIGLMLVSLVAAFILPFEVFLLSYAILGPLHYLTEISWLHDRQYFTPRKLDWVPLTVLGLLILLGAKSIMGEAIYGGLQAMGLEKMVSFLSTYGYDITFVAFGLALIFVVFKDWTYRTAGIIVLLFCAYLFHLPDPIITETSMTMQAYQRKVIEPYDAKWGNPIFKIFGVYVPTLIHVYVFTGLFILFGALKSRSKSGYLSAAMFVMCAIACFVLLPGNPGIVPSSWARANYANTFSQLSLHLLDDFGSPKYDNLLVQSNFGNVVEKAQVQQLVFSNSLSIMFARFIAFAYTYHYLNWFSKTSVIKWHKVPKLRFAIVIVAWIASVALYMLNYEVGFRWLFLLSFLHVMLEFPLNHQSFIGIGKELGAIFSGKQSVAITKSK